MFAVLPARALQIVLAVFIASVIPLRRWAARRSLKLGRRGVLVGGGAFGFISGIVSGTGVFLISLLLATGMPGAAIIATDAAISMLNDSFRLALFGGYARSMRARSRPASSSARSRSRAAGARAGSPSG